MASGSQLHICAINLEWLYGLFGCKVDVFVHVLVLWMQKGENKREVVLDCKKIIHYLVDSFLLYPYL